MTGLVGFVVLLGLGATVWAVVASRRYVARFSQGLERLSARAGLTFHPGGVLRRPSASGFFDRARVVVDTFSRSHGKSSTTYTRICVEYPTSHIIELKREGLGSSLKKAFVGDDVETGDPGFDRAVLIRGSETHLLAMLDENTRVMLRNALIEGVMLKRGVYWEKAGLVNDVDRLEYIVRLCTRISQRISEPVDVPRGLLSNALHDPIPGVRDRNLEVLLTEFRSSPEAQEAARNLRPDHDLRLQIKAASLLGAEGAERLRTFALNTQARVALRQAALATLLTGFARDERTLTALQELAALPSDALTGEALALLRGRGPVALELLEPHVAHPNPRARREVALCAAAHTGPRALAVLLALLAREDEEEAVRVATIEGVGALGDRLAVEPLLPFTKGLFTDGDVKQAARHAVAAIQSRLGAGGAGHLSLADESAGGALALAEGGGLEMAGAADDEKAVADVESEAVAKG